MEFRGMRAGAAQALLTRDYGSVLAKTAANPAASVASAGRVLHYLSDNRALVRTPEGMRVVTSSVPLRLSGGVDGPGPVDLHLRSTGNGFAPVRPVVGVRIAHDSAGGVTVGTQGLRIALRGSDVVGSVVDGQGVFFGGVGADMDATVAPKIQGVDLSVMLRSRLSPQQIRYVVSLPEGATLQAAGHGATVSRDGSTLARVMAPTAQDAQGSGVPVRMSVAGDELVLTIPHRSREVAYPILVDPEVLVANLTETPGNWVYHGAGPIETSFPAGGPIFMHTNGTYHGLTDEQWEGGGGGDYEWEPPEKMKEISAVEILGVSGSVSASSTGGIYNPNYTAEIKVVACGQVFSNLDVIFKNGIESYEEHRLTSIRYTTGEPKGIKCLQAVEVGAGAGGSGRYVKCEPPEPCNEEEQSVTVAAELTVGAVLIYQKQSYTEEVEQESELFGEAKVAKPDEKGCFLGKPVNCATGNQVETQTDLSVGGRGLGLHLTRTYNSLLAGKQSEHGPFGYGWTGSYSAHLKVSTRCGGTLCGVNLATVTQDDGSVVRFERYGSETWKPLGSMVEATLTSEGTGYVYTLPNQSKLYFNSEGVLTSEADRNGNTLTMGYTSGRLTSVTDFAGRKLTFAYNAEGEVESAKDPMGHTVKYTYESGNLKSVTQPAETALRWQFKYNIEHEMTSETDGRGNVTTTEYGSKQRVSSQTDPLKRKREWTYTTSEAGSETTITEPTGAVTVEHFNAAGLITSATHAAGTAIAATTTYEYNASNELTAVTDPDKHTTKYGYDAAGDRTSETDAASDKTEWTYDTQHDVLTTTTPDGETTTIKRDSHGNAESVERPAPGKTTQLTTFKYDAHGDLESMTDPLKRVWSYEYDSYGDRTAETDPEGDKRTWGYNEDSAEISTVSPRGNAKGAEASKYTTKLELDAQNRPIKITDPLGHTTKYTYDGDGNTETMIDGNSNKTKFTYDADNELTKTEEPKGNVIETGYDSAGQTISQTDGNKNVTKFVRNLLEEITEESDPKERKTLKEYDAAGNLISVTDAAKRTTSYTYDPANRVKEVTYSDGKTPAVKYEYNGDGKLTHMTDGTGETTFAYDELDRLAEQQNGHKEKVGYEYDLANELTKLTYPNGKAITRSYDKAGRLEKITDWLSNTTKFAYNPDSQQTATTFPSGTSNEDTYAYNEADQMSEVKMLKGAEVLASLAYTRDDDGQVKGITSKGLPGEEKPAYEYDADNRLKKGGTTAYEYDSANNPTKIGTGSYVYDKASELETGPSVKYTYNQVGQRTTTTPTTGSATTYGYDQAGRMITVERPKEGEIPAIKDSYTYDGSGLRASQTISGTTTYMAWEAGETTPLLLSDGVNSYIYGPSGLPIEQINNSTGTVSYLHHDQAGSTRLLTGSTGTVTGKCTYSPYGTPTCEGTTTTPLGYDAQYTSADTGLQYLRNRVYDPTTAQFLTVDPLAKLTRAPYNYVEDNPVNATDPTGLCSDGSVSGFLDCFNPVSSGNLAYKGATGLSSATGGVVNLPWLLTRPPVVALGAAAVCATPLVDAACPGAIGAVWSVSTSSIVANGIETNFCNPGQLVAEEGVTSLLFGFGALGVYTTGAADAVNAPGYARAIIRGGPALLEALLNGPPAAQGG
jgi:RHS repeat-associated protein